MAPTQPPAIARRPQPGTPLLLLIVASVCVLVWWVWRTIHPARAPSLPLRRVVDLRGTSGVHRRWRVADPEEGRRLLDRLGDTPAALVPASDGWHVWSGPRLTLTPVSEDHPLAVLIEFTMAGRPFLAPKAPAPDATTPGEDGPMPPLRTLSGNAIDLAKVPEPQRIRAFGTLREAARAARVGPNDRGEVDHIVGGSLAHPVYYVVPARVGPDHAAQGAAALVAGSGFDQQVWVRT